MIAKLSIRDNKRTPVHYLHELRAFRNGRKYEFRPGVNIIEMTRGYVRKVTKMVNELVK